MKTNIKRGIVSGAFALSLLGGSAAGVAAQGQNAGAAGLVNAIVQLDDTNIDVIEVSDSLNNLRALNNILNNSPILSNNDINVEDVISDINVLSAEQQEVLTNFLNDLDVDIQDVTVIELSTGDLLVVT